MNFALTQKSTKRLLTWRGWLLIAMLSIGILWGFVTNLYPFLAPEKPPHKGLMVIEGWIHDFALDEAMTIYRAGNYSKIVCTGVPLETGSFLLQYKSYPEMTAARLRKLGIPEEQIMVAVADETKKDRTYMAAIALRKAFITDNLKETNLHLITTGPHGRRSRMLFQKALGKNYTIGITCLDASSYNPEDWYTCSEGVRSVIGEFIAYAYAKFFFYP